MIAQVRERVRVPFAARLAWLSAAGRLGRHSPGLIEWGRSCLKIPKQDERSWYGRARWGLAAGEAVRAALKSPRGREDVLRFVDASQLAGLRDLRADGRGVILAGAHIGPPKVAMNCLVERVHGITVWTNTADLPDWMKGRNGASFANPLDPSAKRLLPARAALHLREGGVLFAAPDWPSGARQHAIDAFGMTWPFSLGLPALARVMNAPCLLVLALWRGRRIRIECARIESPPSRLAEEEWCREWIANYWRLLVPVIREQAENLRFLLHINNGAIRRELGL